MGLAGARNSAVTGLQAQSTQISITADNIANAATVGYKSITGAFSTLVTSSGSSTGFSSGGVSIAAKTLVESQGLIESTGRVTDLALSGQGFFAVQDDSANLLLSRAGSFDLNNTGELVNSGGYKLLGWPLDNDGLRPGEIGNANTTAAESTDSLEVVDTNSASGTASATTTVKVGMNLNAGEVVFQGATLTIQPASTENVANASTDIIVPATGVEEGEEFSLTSNSVTETFTYGGFAKSGDLSDAAVFGASTISTTFSTGTTLADSDKFTISTVASGTVTFTFQQSSPDTTGGQFNSLASLATAINATVGLTARTSGTKLFVSSTDANEAITFGDVGSSDLHNELGFSNEAASASGVNRYNTLDGLSTIINSTLITEIGATVSNASSGAGLAIFASDPQLTLAITKEHDNVEVNLSSFENGAITDTGLIVPVDGSDITAGTSSVSFTDGTNTGTFVYGGVGESVDITATSIFGASTTSGTFTSGATTGLDDGDIITFSNGTDTVAIEYQSTATLTTHFNSLDTIASAINTSSDFVARVVNNKLYVSSNDAVEAVTFNVTTDTGTALTNAGVGTALGGDWGAGTLVTAVANRFNTIAQLDALVDAVTNFDTTLTTGTNASTAISTTDGSSITIGGASNIDLLAELGLATGDVGDGLFTEYAIDDVVAASASTATIAATYDSTDETKNLAGGEVVAHFPRNLQVFDSLGTQHDFRFSALKVGANTWAIEVFALDPTEIVGRDDGQVAAGIIEFNGDGSLRTISAALSQDITIPWTTGASTSTISLNLGTAGQIAGSGSSTIGLTDGIRQFDASFNVEFIEQNGVAAGQFKGITVSDDGTVFANFSNGEIKAIYQLPIVLVANQNALAAETGNVFAITQESGDVNLKIAGEGGSGVIVAGALEGSTADIAEELTRTIGIQANYNANASLISTVKAMEEELNRRL